MDPYDPIPVDPDLDVVDAQAHDSPTTPGHPRPYPVPPPLATSALVFCASLTASPTRSVA